MTEEQARANAKGLALGMGITFYVVHSREDRFLPVQLPSDDCEILPNNHATQQRSGSTGGVTESPCCHRRRGMSDR
jgi:hypothetical protein